MKNLEKYLSVLDDQVDGLLLTSRYSRHYGAEFNFTWNSALEIFLSAASKSAYYAESFPRPRTQGFTGRTRWLLLRAQPRSTLAHKRATRGRCAKFSR